MTHYPKADPACRFVAKSDNPTTIKAYLNWDTFFPPPPRRPPQLFLLQQILLFSQHSLTAFPCFLADEFVFLHQLVCSHLTLSQSKNDIMNRPKYDVKP